jgi:undecaprenyl-diphosphatase
MNLEIFQAINSLAGQSYFLDQVLVFASNVFGYILIGGLLFFLAFHEDKKKGARDVFVVLSAAVAAYVFSKILKFFIDSPRPFEVLPQAHVLYTHGGGDSMPSGHATFYMTLASSLFFFHKKIALAYFIGALIVGGARIAVGVHWPFDILAGFILGGFVGIFSYFVFAKFLQSKIDALILKGFPRK